MTCLNHGAVNHEVVVNEFGWARAVSQNSPHCSSNQEHIIRTIVFEPSIHCALIAQIELCASGRENVGETTGL